MSSLRFTKPIRIKELPDEAAKEWIGLEVGLDLDAPHIFGYLGPVPAREFDEGSKTFTDNTFCNLQEISNRMERMGDFFISADMLRWSCKHSDPPRNNLLAWLASKRTIQYFGVSKDMVEYLP